MEEIIWVWIWIYELTQQLLYRRINSRFYDSFLILYILSYRKEDIICKVQNWSANPVPWVKLTSLKTIIFASTLWNRTFRWIKPNFFFFFSKAVNSIKDFSLAVRHVCHLDVRTNFREALYCLHSLSNKFLQLGRVSNFWII